MTAPACRPAARNGRGRILLRCPPQPARTGHRAAAALEGFCHRSSFQIPRSGRASPYRPAISYQAPTVYPPRVGTFDGREGPSGPCPPRLPGGRLDRAPADERKDERKAMNHSTGPGPAVLDRPSGTGRPAWHTVNITPAERLGRGPGRPPGPLRQSMRVYTPARYGLKSRLSGPEDPIPPAGKEAVSEGQGCPAPPGGETAHAGTSGPA